MNARKHLPTALSFLCAMGLACASASGEARTRFDGIRTTAYTYGADQNGSGNETRNAMGKPLKTGKLQSAAADWSQWPVGTHFRVVETGQEYIVDDTGSALVGTNTIDLFKSSAQAMNRWGVRRVSIEIIEWGSPEKSLEILKDRTRVKHNREMVRNLEKVLAT